MFSVREKAVLKHIGRKSVTIRDLAQQIFFCVMHDEILAGNSVRNIVKKCEFYHLPWTLTKYKKNGKMYIKKGKR